MKGLLIPKDVIRWLYGNSPWSWVVAGTALTLGTPVIAKGLNAVLLTTVKGVINVTDEAARTVYNVKEGWEDIVAEARAGRHPK